MMDAGKTLDTLIQTDRLVLRPLNTTDAEFILLLLNTPGWKRFIGDRQVHTHGDALNYIHKVLRSPQLKYWVAISKADDQPLGIITLIERDYLPGPDLGFAFLPEYNGLGYAQEASAVILQQINDMEPNLYAVTIPENHSSITLLGRLGFTYTHTISHDGEMLDVHVRKLR